MGDPRVLQPIYDHINPGLGRSIPDGYSLAHPEYTRAWQMLWLTENPCIWEIAPLHRYPRAFAGMLDLRRRELSAVPNSHVPDGFICWKLFQILSSEEWDCLTLHIETGVGFLRRCWGMLFLLIRTPATVDAAITQILLHFKPDDMWDELQFRLIVTCNCADPDVLESVVYPNLRRFVKLASPRVIVTSLQRFLAYVNNVEVAKIMWPVVDSQQIGFEPRTHLPQIRDPDTLRFVLHNCHPSVATRLTQLIVDKTWMNFTEDAAQVAHDFCHEKKGYAELI